jgi:hypothetical protein
MDEPENPTFRLRRAKEEVLESTEGHEPADLNEGERDVAGDQRR